MSSLQYDGSFEGLLCVLFEAYRAKRFPLSVESEQGACSLLSAEKNIVPTEPEKAHRVFAALQKKLSPYALHQLFLVWLSEVDERDMLLLRYMRMIVDAPAWKERDFGHPTVFAIHKLARKVSGEAHSMRGFIRFQELSDGIFFSCIEPRYNVLPLVVSHFQKRFGEQRWLIHDSKRAYGYYFDGHSLHPAEVCLEQLNNGMPHENILAEKELLMQRLWQTYYRASTITERKNNRLHRRCLPERYWKFLTEKW